MAAESSPTSASATETSPLLQNVEQQSQHVDDAAVPAADAASSDDSASNDAVAQHAMAGKMHLFLPAVGIGMYLSSLDQTLTMASYAKIGNDLDALNYVGWVITSYLLCLTSSQPIFGKLSDIFGRKECLQAAYSFFALGCLGCGLAPNMLLLCIARAFTGIGAGGIASVVSILVSDLVPLRDRGVWQGYLMVIFSAGLSTGAPIGGFLADSVGWRWSFLGQTPLCLIAMVVIHFVIDVPRPSSDNMLAKLRRIDFAGALFLVLGVSALLLGLDSGPNRGWNTAATIVPLCLMPVFFAVLMLIETKAAENPFAPGHVIFDRALVPVFLVCFFTLAGHFSLFFFAPLYLQAVLNYSATASGTLLLPAIVVGAIFPVLCGWAIKRAGKFYAVIVSSNAVLFVGAVILGVAVWCRSAAVEVVGLMFSQAGSGGVISSVVVALLANGKTEDTAVLISCGYLFRSLGGSAAVSVGSAILQQTLRSQLAARLGDAGKAHEIEEGVRKSLEYINHLSPEIAAEVRTSYQWATLAAVSASIAFALLALVASCLIKDKKLSK